MDMFPLVLYVIKSPKRTGGNAVEGNKRGFNVNVVA